jgi:hypothetical protein
VEPGDGSFRPFRLHGTKWFGEELQRFFAEAASETSTHEADTEQGI